MKSVIRIIRVHEVQLVNYLIAAGKPVEMVINFGERKARPACPDLAGSRLSSRWRAG